MFESRDESKLLALFLQCSNHQKSDAKINVKCFPIKPSSTSVKFLVEF